MALTNEQIRAREGGDFAIIDDNYSERQVKVAIASRLGKIGG